MKRLFLLILCALPAVAHAGDPVPGIDVSLEQIPGPKYRNPSTCTAGGNNAVTVNGVTYCALANSHNTTRSNTRNFISLKKTLSQDR